MQWLSKDLTELFDCFLLCMILLFMPCFVTFLFLSSLLATILPLTLQQDGRLIFS